jgi:hypothetical protein
MFSYRPWPEPGPVGVNVDPLGELVGASVFPDGFMVVGLLGVVEPVALPVPIPVVDPPTDEPGVPPLIEEPPVPELAPAELPPPLVCASANVLESANAVARAIVVSFIVRSLCVVSADPTRRGRLMFRFSRACERFMRQPCSAVRGPMSPRR